MSIYFPQNFYYSSYDFLRFSEDYHWDEFLQKYKKGMETPPVISNVQAIPSSQVAGGWVNITCEVTDDTAVDTVKVNITYPTGDVLNVTMNNIAGTNIYYYNSTYLTLGTYYYFIWSNDTNGKSNRSTLYSFICNDWNPWNDPNSEGGENITTAELQEAIHCWLNDLPAPKTNAEVTTERLQEIIHLWLNC